MSDFVDRGQNHIVWRGYNRPCGTPYYQYQYSMPTWYESVESYRGKTIYVDVQGKRKKAFHPFKRYRYRHNSPKNVAHWCSGSKNLWAEDYQYMAWWMRATGYLSSPIYGDSMPLILQKDMQDFGEEFREFVIRDLYVKVNEPRFDVAVFFAELDETLVGIHKLLKGAAGSLLKTGQAVKHLRHFTLNGEELWLWYRYMLMPLILEMNDLIAAITPPEKIDRIQDGSQLEDRLTGTCDTGLQFNTWTWPLNWETKFKCGSGGALDIKLLHDPSPWGTSAVDVLRAGWERLLLSFVVDWFINVGDYLQTLRSLELELVQSYATFAIEAETKITLEGMDYYEDDSIIINTFLQERIIDVEPPKYPLIDKRWRNCLRTLDGIALIIGMLKGILRRK